MAGPDTTPSEVPDVLAPDLRIEPRPSTACRHRIAEARLFVRDVRQRERLPSKCERRDVVPAGKVLGAEDEAPAWSQDPVRLGNHPVGVTDVFDHLVR
jgi:hypothetical protein